MKKLIITIVVITLFINMFSISSNAVVAGDDAISLNNSLDLSQYTLEDLCNMTSEEYYQLCQDFDRIYDPFGDYAERHETSNSANEISPLWMSSRDDPATDDYVPGTHAMITAQAMLILQNDNRLWCDTALEAVVTTLTLSLASEVPDSNAALFLGHFYNPDSEENYLGTKTPTAKTFAKLHYDNATSTSSVETALDEIGRCLHFVQDISVPHHTALITAVNPSHSAFEAFANSHIEEYMAGVPNAAGSTYNYVNSLEIGQVIREYSYYSLSKINYVDEEDEIDENNANCIAVARGCTQFAAKLSAAILYKFSQNTTLV